MDMIAAARETLELAKNHCLDRVGPSGIDESLDYPHLEEMFSKMSEGTMSQSKLGRWLGWMQAAVVSADVGINLEDMKNINRKHADSDPYELKTTTKFDQERLNDLITKIEKTFVKKQKRVTLQAILYESLLILKSLSSFTHLPISTVPKDTTLVRLLVRTEDHPIEDVDDLTPYWTVGHCSFENTGEENFTVVGWNWEQDRYINQEIEPNQVLGWLPM